MSGARPTALLSAVATFLAALCVCLGPSDAHHPRARTAEAASAGITLRTDVAGPDAAPAAVAAEYTCPYDNSDCGFIPHLNPAVLTAPLPADPLGAADVSPPRLAPPISTGQVPRSGARPRAPDLHVLQVLRT